MIGSLPSRHASYLDTIIRKLSSDRRFVALLAGGSLVHGEFDDYSDLDLIPVVQADDYDCVLSERHSIAAGVDTLLAAFTGEHVGEPRLLICLYGPELLHVDLKFVIPSALNHMVEHPKILWARDPEAMEKLLDQARVAWPELSPGWFEARAWIWLHYGATKLQRGELYEAMGMVAFFREKVLGPMLHRRAGKPQRGLRKIERQDISAMAALEPTVAVHTGSSVRDALKACAGLYLDLRNDNPPPSTVPGMPQLLDAILQ
ncbi:MAG: hypothetical protein ACRECY_18705 [Phyllobacterium sp.]